MSKLIATVTIKKSFDDGRVFTKEWEAGDLHEFLQDEGRYVDRLCAILDEVGTNGDDFTISYEINIRKE